MKFSNHRVSSFILAAVSITIGGCSTTSGVKFLPENQKDRDAGDYKKKNTPNSIPKFKKIERHSTKKTDKISSADKEKLARVYMATGSYQKAKPILTAWMTQKKRSSSLYERIDPALLLATVQTELGEYEEAETNFKLVEGYLVKLNNKRFGDVLTHEFLEAYTRYLNKTGQKEKYEIYLDRLNKSVEKEKELCKACGMG